jgi:hypothetical protein
MRVRLHNGCAATARPWPVASHSSKRRSAVATSPASAAAVSKSTARHASMARSASARVACVGVRPSRRRAPSRWWEKFACTRTKPSAARYSPENVSQTSGTRPSRLNQHRHSAAACSMSTATSWRGAPRRWPSSQAASAAAAMVTCAAVPTAKEEGNTGSAPKSRSWCSASSGSPASCHRPFRACRAGVVFTGPRAFRARPAVRRPRPCGTRSRRPRRSRR